MLPAGEESGTQKTPPLISLLAATLLGACNAVPSAPVVAIVPDEPTTDDDLEVEITTEAADADGRILFYRTVWTRDGAHILELDDETSVSADRTARDEVWEVEVRAVDDELDPGAPGTAAVTIANSPPSAAVTIAPAAPTVNDALVAEVVTDDADEDEVTFALAWDVDGEPQPDLDGVATVPASLTEAEQVWTVTVVPDDGIDSGAAASASVTIGEDARPAAFAWCAGGGHATNGSLSAVLCASPLDLASEPATNGELTWYPGPLRAIAQ